MSTLKKHGRPHKDQASVAACSFSKVSFQSGENKFSALLGALNKLASLSNPGPSSAPFQILKYTKDDLQQILKTVMEAQISACGQDRRISEDSLEWALKLKALDIYKGKLHMDYYNFIQ